MKLLVFGLSISSSWGNGHATIYRGLLKALHRLGVECVFVERDMPWYAGNRDLPRSDFASIVLYGDVGQLEDVLAANLRDVDVVMVGSYFPDGIVLVDRLARHPGILRLYYDIDTPVSLAAFDADGRAEYLRADQLPSFDAVLSFTGGRALAELKQRWGARKAMAFYCALDPEVHTRVEPDDRFRCRLGYMGTYSADRRAPWEELFLRPSLRLPNLAFVLAGPQYPPMELPPNVRHYQHLPPRDHAAFYSSCELSLNLTRAPMAAYGYSPSVRLFEAAGCGSCIASDPWEGLGAILEIDREVLVVQDEERMVRRLTELTLEEAREIGEAARRRVRREHTYDVRARQFLDIISNL